MILDLFQRPVKSGIRDEEERLKGAVSLTAPRCPLEPCSCLLRLDLGPEIEIEPGFNLELQSPDHIVRLPADHNSVIDDGSQDEILRKFPGVLNFAVLRLQSLPALWHRHVATRLLPTPMHDAFSSNQVMRRQSVPWVQFGCLG